MRSDAKQRRRRIAWILIVVVDVAYIAWGGMAALAPAHLLGPGHQPILVAEFEAFTRHSWSQLASTVPAAPQFITTVFRVYGAYCVVFGVLTTLIAITAFRRGERWAWWALLLGNTFALGAAMRFDYVMHAIGPFELTEYLGLVLVWVALAMTATDMRAPALRGAA